MPYSLLRTSKFRIPGFQSFKELATLLFNEAELGTKLLNIGSLFRVVGFGVEGSSLEGSGFRATYSRKFKVQGFMVLGSRKKF